MVLKYEIQMREIHKVANRSRKQSNIWAKRVQFTQIRQVTNPSRLTLQIVCFRNIKFFEIDSSGYVWTSEAMKYYTLSG